MQQGDAITLNAAGIDALVARLLAAAEAGDGGRRWLVGLAGVAGSGKSTLFDRLAGELNRYRPGVCATLGMDAFHLPNAVLAERGISDVKGAPHTYDAPGYVALLARCRDRAHTGRLPVYDRRVHEAVLSDDPRYRLTPRTRVVLTEGQYLLMTRPPWGKLAGVLDETWWLDVPLGQARRWVLGRHRRVGRSPEEAEARYRSDLANARALLAARRGPDLTLRWPAEALADGHVPTSGEGDGPAGQ